MLPLAALALSVPLYFEPNQGQAPAQVRYLATTSQYSLYLSDTAITTNFSNGASLRMNLPRSSPEGLGSLPGKTHYHAGSDPSIWLTVPQYARVRYRAVFPGVDLVVYRKQHQLEYDWVVAPGADPASIRFAFSGASTMRVDEHGDLVLAAAGGGSGIVGRKFTKCRTDSAWRLMAVSFWLVTVRSDSVSGNMTGEGH